MEGGKHRLTQSLLSQIFRLRPWDPAPTTQSDPPTSQGHGEEEQDTIINDDVHQEVPVPTKDDGNEETRVMLMTEAFEHEPERLLSDDLDLDLDDIDAAMDEVDANLGEAATNVAITGDTNKEPSRTHLRSLEGVLQMLLESPCITLTIDANYVGKQAHKGKTLSPNECLVVAELANKLRAYIPRGDPAKMVGQSYHYSTSQYRRPSWSSVTPF